MDNVNAIRQEQAAAEAEREACARIVCWRCRNGFKVWLSEKSNMYVHEGEHYGHTVICPATEIRSRGSSDALKEMLDEAQKRATEWFAGAFGYMDRMTQLLSKWELPEAMEKFAEWREKEWNETVDLLLDTAKAEARKQGALELEQALERQMCGACRDGEEPRRTDNAWVHDRLDWNGNPGPPFLCGATTLRDHIAKLEAEGRA